MAFVDQVLTSHFITQTTNRLIKENNHLQKIIVLYVASLFSTTLEISPTCSFIDRPLEGLLASVLMPFPFMERFLLPLCAVTHHLPPSFIFIYLTRTEMLTYASRGRSFCILSAVSIYSVCYSIQYTHRLVGLLPRH